jgi:ribosomal protein S18 acetylase RimI-like enzyme
VVEIRYRAACAADAAAIAAIHVASWRDAYASILEPTFLAGPIEADRLSFWTTRLENAPPTQLVEIAEDSDQRLVGFVCAYLDHDPEWGSLVDNLHVLPGLRGHSIGERLLRSAARQLKQHDPEGGLHLWVFEANDAGLRFYLRLGGRVVQHDVSRIPAANGKPVLRVHWPELDALAKPSN